MFGLPVLSTRHLSHRARPSWTRTVGLVGAAMLLTIMGSAQEKPAAPASPPPQNKPAEFVGATTCQMCPEDIFHAFQTNPPPTPSPAAEKQAGGIRRVHSLPDVSRGYLQRLPEEPSPNSGNRQKTRLGYQSLRELSRAGQQEIGRASCRAR